IVALNQGFIGADVAGPITASNGDNIFGSDVATPNLGDIENASAMDLALGPLGDNGGPTPTIALLPGSIAIEGGVNADALDQNGVPLIDDQRGPGFARIENGTVDVGAFEFGSGSNMMLQPFPPLMEDEAVNSSLINGLPGDLLFGDGISEIILQFDGETASFENSLGFYRLNEDGGFAGIELLFANLDDPSLSPPGSEISLGVLEADERFGFFLIKKGFTLNPLIQSDGTNLQGTLQFIDPSTWQPGNISDNNPLRLYLQDGNGPATKIVGPILHAATYDGDPTSNALNPDAAIQTLSGLTMQDEIKFGFEDNPIGTSPSDQDFNDAIFTLRFEPPPMTTADIDLA
ncbi:MAG: choice-of-anchor Q domain-containing protein, partial [Pseudomonadota bacterium]